MTTTTDYCCPHGGLDHHAGKCTIPNCPCQGWIPRSKASGKRPSGVPEKILALKREGLTSSEIRSRLQVSGSLITNTLRKAST